MQSVGEFDGGWSRKGRHSAHRHAVLGARLNVTSRRRKPIAESTCGLHSVFNRDERAGKLHLNLNVRRRKVGVRTRQSNTFDNAGQAPLLWDFDAVIARAGHVERRRTGQIRGLRCFWKNRLRACCAALHIGDMDRYGRIWKPVRQHHLNRKVAGLGSDERGDPAKQAEQDE